MNDDIESIDQAILKEIKETEESILISKAICDYIEKRNMERFTDNKNDKKVLKLFQ